MVMPLLKDKKVYFTVRFIWKHDVMTTIVVIVISYKYSFVILHRHCPLYIHVQRQPVAGGQRCLHKTSIVWTKNRI